MTTYKLYYFDARGRAEETRWLFAHAGVQFEDIRLAGKDWEAKKPTLPFSQMPVLEVVEGKGKSTMIPQSHSIERFLAREFNLGGSNSLEMARADFLSEYLTETINKIPFTEKDEEKRNKLVKECVEGAVADNFKVLENFVGESGYLVGCQATYADMAFATKAEMVLKFSPNLLDKTPKLKKLYETVRNLPGVAAWLGKRPDTRF